MREHLYRGKNQLNNQWEFGHLLVAESGRTYIVLCRDTDEGIIWGGLYTPRVTPKTVGQFTGLLANGVKIFEGDIVELCIVGDEKRELSRRGYVVWKDSQWIIEDGNSTLIWRLRKPDSESQFLEIISNIYDNPELLTGQGKENENI